MIDVRQSVGERQVPDWRSRWPYFDLDVVAEAIQTIHQLAFRQVGEVAMHHP